MNQALIVDDSAELRALIALALEGEGYDVITAANGREALDLLATSRPAFIILDLMMPIMNGPEFLAAKATLPELSDIPVVVCTALSDVEIACAGILQKPVDLKSIVALADRFRPAVATPSAG